MTISPNDVALEMPGAPKPQVMLYTKCSACNGSGEHAVHGVFAGQHGATIGTCPLCRGEGYVVSGLVISQVERFEQMERLRMEAGITAAMLRDGRARRAIELFHAATGILRNE